MSWFDALFVLAVLAASIAMTRVRPALLILAANEAIVLRALANIDRYGKPASQQFLPDSAFSHDNILIAGTIFGITIAITLLFTLIPNRTIAAAPASLPRVPSWLMTVLILYFLVLTFSQRTILSQTYSDPARTLYSANFGGGTAFLNSIFLYEIVRRTMAGELRPALGFGIVLLLFLGTDYLHGSTGLATGFVVVAAVFIFGPQRPLRRTITVAAILSGLFALSLSIRIIRSSFSTDARGGFSQVVSSVRERSAQEQRDAEGVENMGNGTQYAAHVLECISLYKAGESRQWRSIYNPIIYTFEPSFLTGPLGIVRPREAAWELSDYFIHGGGIFVIGELYWNGGYLCTILVFFALVWACWKSDVSYRSGFSGLMMACNIGPNLLQGAGYGFAQVCRGVINGLLALLIWNLARKLRFGTHRAPEASPEAAR